MLAGGVGERLAPLTSERAKPAVYFGGPYRIIDFVLSNCINSGLRRVFIATQYKSLSLNRHIRQGWSVVSEELGEFIEILPPQKRVGEHWYQGTADAVYQNLYSIVREEPRYVVVLAGDHVYKMDYLRMLRFHQEQDATVTLAAIEVPVEDGRRFGIVAVDEQRPRDRLSGEARATRRRCPGSRTWPWRRWASTSSTATCWCARSRTTPRIPTASTTSAGTSSRRSFRGGRIYAYPLLRREQEGGEVLARHRHPRRVLRSQHGPLPGEPGVQPVRSRVAAAHLHAAGAARQVRLRRGLAPRRGAGFADFARLHRLRQPHSRQHSVPQRPRAQLLPHRVVDPDAGRAGRPARAHPSCHHRSRRPHPARRAASDTNWRRIAAATPSATGASWSSPPAKNR